jgi:hypothetical protein
VIDRRHGEVRPADFQPARFQTGKSLRRSHLMDQVAINVEDSGRACFLDDNMTVPDFLE